MEEEVYIKINMDLYYSIKKIINKRSRCIKNQKLLYTSNCITQILLLFNIFENCFERNKKNEKKKIISFSKNFSDDIAEPFFSFFKKRYVTNNIINNSFSDLFFYINNERENNPVKDWEKKIKENLINNTEKVFTVFSICYRFRNNIFHGNKHICLLKDYIDCYENIINFMEILLDIKSNC